MSQYYVATSSGGGSGTVQFLQGNSGGDVGPNVSGEIFIVGTGGVNVTGTPLTNTLTISVSASGISWSDKAASFAAAASNGYFVTATATATLPASPSQGDTIEFNVVAATTLTVQANTGQFIRIGNSISAAAGTSVNTMIGDSLVLIYRSASTTWQAQNSMGGWNTV